MIFIGWMASGVLGFCSSIKFNFICSNYFINCNIFKIITNDYKPNKRRLNMFKLLVILGLVLGANASK